ncbi:extracellular solute-binding protein [Actinomadura keratinilytica]
MSGGGADGHRARGRPRAGGHRRRCGSGEAEEGTGEEVALRLVAPEYGDSAENSSKGYWKRVVAGFEKGHPGTTVDVEVHPWRTVDKVLARQVATGNAPDLAISGTYASYAADGKLYRADDLLSIGTQADFRRRSRAPGRSSGCSTACRSPPRPGCSSTTATSSRRRA